MLSSLNNAEVTVRKTGARQQEGEHFMQEHSGSHILITGPDRFIGSHLTECLLDEGAVVVAFCVYNSNGAFGCASHGATSAMIAPAESTFARNEAPYRRERFGSGYTSSVDPLVERLEKVQCRVIDAFVDFSS